MLYGNTVNILQPQIESTSFATKINTQQLS